MTKEKYEVIVVGAGPAGSTAAKKLAEKGIKTLLVDKDKFPRQKPCGGGLTFRALQRFPCIRETNIIEAESHKGIICSHSLNKKAEIYKSEPLISMVKRDKLDLTLTNLAKDSGVFFKDNKKVTELKKYEGKVEIRFNDDTKVDTKMVIGADGVNSTITKKSDINEKHNIIGVSVLSEIKINRETIEEFYKKELNCYIHHNFKKIAGYGWVFPKKNSINVGIVEYRNTQRKTNKNKNLKKTFNEYILFLKNQKIIPNSVISKKTIGGILPFHPLSKTYSDKLLLCGDAAGFINPLTGEGLYYALTSGEIAAKVCHEAIKENNTSQEFLKEYEVLWKKDFGVELFKMLKIANRYATDSEKFVELLKNDNKLLTDLF